MLKRFNRWYFWLGGVLLLIVAVAAGLSLLPARQEVASIERVEVIVGDLSSSTSASGTVLPVQEASLAMASTGIVTEVLVQVGQEVQAGEVLVQLDDSSARIELELAQLKLEDARLSAESAQIDLESTEQDLQDDIDWAYSQIDDAEADLADAQAAAADPDAQDEMAQVRVNLQQAWNTYDDARARYEQLLGTESDCNQPGRSCPGIGGQVAAAYDAVIAADENYQVALAQYNLQVENLENAVDEAEDYIDDLNDDIYTTTESLTEPDGQLQQSSRSAESAKLALQQAELSVEQAQESLDRLTLVAPFDGIITAVHVEIGEQASGIVVEMMSSGDYEVTLDVDEVDVGSLAIGQPASIVLEAWPSRSIESRVASIAPRAAESSDGVVSYEVRLQLPDSELPVRVGMTANATITTEQLTGVLLVPNRAITSDRATGKYYVNLVEGETVTQVEVQIGARDGQYTQVLSGLAAGDILQISSTTLSFGPGGDDAGGGPGFMMGGPG